MRHAHPLAGPAVRNRACLAGPTAAGRHTGSHQDVSQDRPISRLTRKDLLPNQWLVAGLSTCGQLAEATPHVPRDPPAWQWDPSK